MKKFTSDISKQEFPISEHVSATTLRDSILREIQQDYPEFNRQSSLSVSELNYYRQQHVKNLLAREVGRLAELEKTVIENMEKDHLISVQFKDNDLAPTRSQRWADRLASFGGSWRFIGIFIFVMIAWISWNVFGLHDKGFDPYPFILLNLILSCIAAIQAPVIMMSQNRQEEKDRERARNDYMINLKSELEIRMLHEKIDHLLMSKQEHEFEIQQVQIDMMDEIMGKIDMLRNVR